MPRHNLTALSDDAVWVESNLGGRVTLVATPAGLAAIGIEPGAAPAAAPPDTPSVDGNSRRRGTLQPAVRAPTDGGAKQSKQDLVLAMLRRPQRTSVPEMVAATGWQPHSVRGFMSGPLKRRLKLVVTSEKEVGSERRYHVSVEAEQT